ncbi:MAG: protein BatD, partial [Muribaculaceae bacterium]|nr:protein BatD [Muribaculaceae bacterium]
RLKAAKSAMDAHRSDEFYASLASAIWGYLSDKLSIPASGLTRDNIAEKLGGYGLGEAQTQNILDVLDQCEMARFTPSGSDEQMAGLYEKASQAVSEVENVKKQ